MTATSDLEQARRRSLEVWNDMASGWKDHGDYIWDATRHVGEWLVSHVDPQPGQTILDVAAGPGDTGFAAANLAGDTGKVVSTDFSKEMVDVARYRAGTLGVPNAEFKVMDAENMDLPNESVDAVLCRWGFMLMLDPQSALTECARVLRPGGRLAFAVWGSPEKNPWVTLTGMIMTQQGHPPQGDPFGPGGMFSMADHDEIGKMLDRAGFSDVEIDELDVTWHFADFEDFWAFLNELAGAIAAAIKTLPDEDVARLRDALVHALEPFKTADGYEMSGVTVCAAASKN